MGVLACQLMLRSANTAVATNVVESVGKTHLKAADRALSVTSPATGRADSTCEKLENEIFANSKNSEIENIKLGRRLLT